MSIYEEAAEGLWWFKKTEDDGIVVKINDSRVKTKNGNLTEKVVETTAHPGRGQDRHIVISFEDRCSSNGVSRIDFSLDDFEDNTRFAYDNELSKTLSAKEFSKAFNERVLSNAVPLEEECQLVKPALVEVEEKAPGNVKAMSQLNKKKKGKGKIEASAAKKRSVLEEKIDLPSPSKKFKPNSFDQEIDAHYLGHIYVKVDALMDSCPESWLDRPIDELHVKEIEMELTRAPTSAKSQQPWMGIADIERGDLETMKNSLKGCRITVIGGRHRLTAYKKVSQVSSLHKRELEKVWIHLYDNNLKDEEIRRLAAMHNVSNRGSMSTNWVTRVHSCRQWLYTMAGKDVDLDETPSSSSEWKKNCQKMYVAGDKDENTLEPTLQAALRIKEVYNEFRRVCDMFSKNSLKDQSRKKKTKKGKSSPELTQNQLGMPLQGLSDETKLDLLKQITSGQISLKELRTKSSHIKKKQLVIAAFLNHTGEESWEGLKARFPLHTREEKIAQFHDSAITKRKIPEEIINYFERAIKWEENKADGPIRLQEEREGVYFLERSHKETISYGILMEGSFGDIPLPAIKQTMRGFAFKGFPLVLATFVEGMTAKDVHMFLINVHAANVELLQRYSVIFFCETEDGYKITEEKLKTRMSGVQRAYWVNTKPKRLQGCLMDNSVQYVLIGHWAKDGKISESHCHFSEGENASNAFCFDEEKEKRLPSKLVEHIIDHFSFEGQWILDLSFSQDVGIVAALKQGRNCVSLMAECDLRETAAIAVKAVQDKDDTVEELCYDE